MVAKHLLEGGSKQQRWCFSVLTKNNFNSKKVFSSIVFRVLFLMTKSKCLTDCQTFFFATWATNYSSSSKWTVKTDCKKLELQIWKCDCCWDQLFLHLEMLWNIQSPLWLSCWNSGQFWEHCLHQRNCGMHSLICLPEWWEQWHFWKKGKIDLVKEQNFLSRLHNTMKTCQKTGLHWNIWQKISNKCIQVHTDWKKVSRNVHHHLRDNLFAHYMCHPDGYIFGLLCTWINFHKICSLHKYGQNVHQNHLGNPTDYHKPMTMVCNKSLDIWKIYYIGNVCSFAVALLFYMESRSHAHLICRCKFLKYCSIAKIWSCTRAAHAPCIDFCGKSSYKCVHLFCNQHLNQFDL